MDLHDDLVQVGDGEAAVIEGEEDEKEYVGVGLLEIVGEEVAD